MSMAEHDNSDAQALLSRVRLIEQQPLEQRADAFVRIHEELHAALEGADTPRA